jgi:homoserine dehydrogenase
VTRVALLGFGTVGSAFARRLTSSRSSFLRSNSQPFVLTHIFDRRADEKRRSFATPSPLVWTSRIDHILQSSADVVVEAIGGVDPAREWVRDALIAGKSVVTANKQLVAHHGPELWKLAERQGRQLRFEAAVGGAMPILRAIDGLAGDRVTRIVGILNGTANAVLSRMERGGSLDDALADARRRGYAEADPSADLRGDDARAKLAILCALAFGVRVDPGEIPARTIEDVDANAFAAARRERGTIRQLAHAAFDWRRGALDAWVAPVVVPRDSIFGRAAGPQNAAVITGEHAGDIEMSGAGAGGDATAVALLSDVAAIARDRAAVVPAPCLTSDFTFSAHVDLAEAV